MPLRWSQAADEDARQIYLFGEARFGAAVADRYAANLWRAVALIADHPRIALVREEMAGEVCAYPTGSHVIVYKVEGEDVVIVRIRHSREDWQHDD